MQPESTSPNFHAPVLKNKRSAGRLGVTDKGRATSPSSLTIVPFA